MKISRSEILAQPFYFGKVVAYKQSLAIGLFIMTTGFSNLSHAACEAEAEKAIPDEQKRLGVTLEQARAIFISSIAENEKYFRRLNAEQYAKQEAELVEIIKTNPARPWVVTAAAFQLCMLRNTKSNSINQSSGSVQLPERSQSSSQQNQAAQQQAQQAQQQAQQTQQLAAQNQARADQARQGKRRTHDPAAEAHECIAIDNAGSGNFGAFKNTCSYRVNFYTCNYKPRVTQGGFNWSADFDCEKQQHGMHTPGAGVSIAAHNRNTETVHWFACKAPASPVDVSFVQGQGLSGRCN